MTLQIKKNILKKGLDIVGKSVSSKNIIPIISYVLFSVKEGKLSISANNLDSSIVTTVEDGRASDGFKATVEFKKLNDVVSKLSGDEITMWEQGGMMEIVSGKNKFKLKTLPVEDFPDAPVKNELIFSIETSKLLKSIAYTSFATSTEAIKPALTALSIKLMDGKMEAVGTNGHRLAMITQDIDFKGEEQLLIPATSLTEVARLANLIKPDKISFYRSRKNIVIEVGGTVYTTRTIEANYPNYNAVIRNDIAEGIVINRQELFQEIQVVDTVDADVLKLSLKNGTLGVSAENKEDNAVAEGSIWLEYKGEPIEAEFNIKYLTDMLRNVTMDKFSIDMRNEGATIIYGADYKYLLMPLKG